jgi:hypothetical protein
MQFLEAGQYVAVVADGGDSVGVVNGFAVTAAPSLLQRSSAHRRSISFERHEHTEAESMGLPGRNRTNASGENGGAAPDHIRRVVGTEDLVLTPLHRAPSPADRNKTIPFLSSSCWEAGIATSAWPQSKHTKVFWQT